MRDKSVNKIAEIFKEFSARDRKALKRTIIQRLQIKSEATFYSQKNGKSDLKVSQAKVIAEVLGKTLNDLYY